MHNRIIRIAAACTCLAALVATSAAAQAPAPAKNVVVVEKPTYTTVPLEITVNKPVADVWKRIGKYCDIAEILQIAAGCTIISGKDGEPGAVRSLATEVMVAATQYSYTYTQTPRPDRPYNLYHGTLEARAITSTTTKILYTLMFDNSMLPDDAAREKDKASRAATFTRALANMKILAEGGTLPPPAPAPAR
jgi:hypothetical protein